MSSLSWLSTLMPGRSAVCSSESPRLLRPNGATPSSPERKKGPQPFTSWAIIFQLVDLKNLLGNCLVHCKKPIKTKTQTHHSKDIWRLLGIFIFCKPYWQTKDIRKDRVDTIHIAVKRFQQHQLSYLDQLLLVNWFNSTMHTFRITNYWSTMTTSKQPYVEAPSRRPSVVG